ncbi:MAG TPA: P-loop NTPase [Spirochaetia bacterium]|nr:P-loop NTPase [Spirochaetia bacterium]
MAYVIPVASGKGGVGKTIFSANLGVALARFGKTVILADLDLGASNLHTCLGIRNNHAGIGSFVTGMSQSLEELVTETSEPRLYLISGDGLVPGVANLPYFRKARLIKQLDLLVADFVILDLGAGSAYNTVDFFLASPHGIVVTTSETTAILNAYSFLKTTLYRLLYRSFPARSAERMIIGDFVNGRIEGADVSFRTLVERLSAHDESSAQTAANHLSAFRPSVVLNMARNTTDLGLGGKLRQIVKRNLSVDVEYVGLLPYDSAVGDALNRQITVASAHPESPFSQALNAVAKSLMRGRPTASIQLYLDDEDLHGLAKFLPSDRGDEA